VADCRKDGQDVVNDQVEEINRLSKIQKSDEAAIGHEDQHVHADTGDAAAAVEDVPHARCALRVRSPAHHYIYSNTTR
jgi:hypothetical protein